MTPAPGVNSSGTNSVNQFVSLKPEMPKSKKNPKIRNFEIRKSENPIFRTSENPIFRKSENPRFRKSENPKFQPIAFRGRSIAFRTLAVALRSCKSD